MENNRWQYGIEQLMKIKKQWICSWHQPDLHHISTGPARPFQRDSEMEINVMQYCEVLQRGGALVNSVNEWTEHGVWPALVHTAQVEHPKVGASDHTWSNAAYIILPQIENEQCHTQNTLPVKKTCASESEPSSLTQKTLIISMFQLHALDLK